MARLQVDISDDLKMQFEQLVKGHGMTQAGLIAHFIQQTGAPASTSGGNGAVDKVGFDVLMVRLNQIQEEVNVERHLREQSIADLAKHVQDLLQRVAEAIDSINDLYKRNACITETLEPLIGVALRPGVLYNPVAPPKRAWWRVW